MKHTLRVLCRALAALAVAAALWTLNSNPVSAQGGLTISSPAAGAILAAGPDYATDVLGDPWDMSNVEDVARDPAQVVGWTNFSVANGVAGGTTALVNGASNATTITFLQRAYYGILNPGRTGRRYPIDTSKYAKLAFKMNSTRGDQSPRIGWFHNDLGDPVADGFGMRYVDPVFPTPAGNNIFVVDLTQNLLAGQAWSSGVVKGFILYPNSSAVGYPVSFDWVRLTAGDAMATATVMPISWSGGSGTSMIQVTDAGGSTYTVASGISATTFNWNSGVLPPGSYTLKVTRGSSVGTTTFKVNAPPTIHVTDPDETGGQDYATAVLGNAWDMNDPADTFYDNGATIVDHLISRVFSGGLFNGTSDGACVANCGTSIPIGDPQVYVFANNPNNTLQIDTTRYRFLTFGLQVDGAFDLARGSVARVFWGSATGSGAPYNLTTTKDIITWPGMNTYSVDLAALNAGPDGGLEPAGAATPWMTNKIRYLRIDPHEFGEVRDFHLDFVKLAAMNEAPGSFTIKFTGSDPDGDPVTVALYYDTDTNPSSGFTLIASGIPLANGQYVWNTSNVPGGVYYVYAVASDGRNSTGGYATGPVRVTPPASNPLISIDTPGANATVGQPFLVGGWAIDTVAPSGTGVDAVHIYAYPNPGSGASPVFLGAATYGSARGDIGAAFGAQFTNSGFNMNVSYLKPGPYMLAAYPHSTVTNGFSAPQTRTVTVAPGPLMAIDTPGWGATGVEPFAISGWAIDSAASTGTGVDAIHVWAYPNPGSGQSPVFVGTAAYGASRPDLGSAYGTRFTNSGFTATVRGLAPGLYQFVVFAHSTATGTFNQQQAVNVTVKNQVLLAIDAPAQNASVTPPFLIGGWALDRAAASGTGVDAIHVWAYPVSGAPPFMLGVATYGTPRSDLGSIFGSQFTNCGYNLTVTSLAKGTYDIVVWAHSSVSGTFDLNKVVRVTVP